MDRLDVAGGGELLPRPFAADLVGRLRRVRSRDGRQRRLDAVEAVDPDDLLVEVLRIDVVRRLGARREVVVAPGGDGDPPDTVAARSARSMPKPRPVSQRSASAAAISAPAKASSLARSSRPWRCQERPGSRTSRAPASTVPPATSAISAAARDTASAQISGSAPRSKRWLASVCMPNRRAAARTRRRSKWAPSIRMSRVASVTSLSSPPMTPPRPTGRSASAITRISGSSSRSTPSRVVSRSPARARRATRAPPASLPRS